MSKVLVVGSANMDTTIYTEKFPCEGETIFAQSKFIQPGGKGANQAAAAGKSGLTNVEFLCALGNDAEGKEIYSSLKECGVNIAIKQSLENTGSAFICVNSTSQNEIIIHHGANFDLLPDDLDEKLFVDADIVVLQNEIPQETNEKAIEFAHKYGCMVIYNPAPFRPIKTDLFKLIDIFNVNEVELKQYTNEGNIFMGIKKLHKLGVDKLLITLGKDGSMFSDKGKQISVESIKVKAIDTVAAGDTYVGYFAAALAAGYSEEKAMKIATKASSICVTKKGSLKSIPLGKEVL